MAPRRYCFVFVCQAGELEIKALLLAASLKRFVRCDYELVAAVPGPVAVWGELSASTIQVLQALDVRIEPVLNPIDPSYKIGNKLACLGISTRAEKIVFLDSDILCLDEFNDEHLFDVPFAAKPADLRTFSADVKDWAPAYAAAGVAPPQLHLPTTVSSEFGLPYFNSGVIFADAKADLGSAWVRCARAIDAEPSMKPHRHWLDQVSLAIAVRQLGLSYASLDERFNFPAHLKPLPAQGVIFCHYHWPCVLRSEARLAGLVRFLARESPALAALMGADADWTAALQIRAPVALRRRIPARREAVPADLIVTGIPGSGAADVCDLIAQYDNVAVVDTNAAVETALMRRQIPWEVAAFLRAARCDLLDGKSLPYLHRADAPPGQDAALYTSRPRADDFVLAVYNPLAFLCRLDALKRVVPQARLIACIADPFQTIAAWKRAEPALRDADVANLALGHPDAVWLTRGESALLHDIAAITDPAERRARLWWWLAQRLLNQADGVLLVRRQELRVDPAGAVRAILRGKHPGRTKATPTAPPGPDTATLDDSDRQAIRAICAQAAADLGVPGEP
jgi:hypothetical protein